MILIDPLDSESREEIVTMLMSGQLQKIKNPSEIF